MSVGSCPWRLPAPAKWRSSISDIQGVRLSQAGLRFTSRSLGTSPLTTHTQKGMLESVASPWFCFKPRAYPPPPTHTTPPPRANSRAPNRARPIASAAPGLQIFGDHEIEAVDFKALGPRSKACAMSAMDFF